MKKSVTLAAPFFVLASLGLAAEAPRPRPAPAQQTAPAPTQQTEVALELTPAPAHATTAALGSKVWVGRHAEFEEYLKTAAIEKVTDIPIGVTKPRRAFFVQGGIAASAALKHLPRSRKTGYWEAYQSEIAAYKLDRLLGLDMVPPTVERRVSGELSSLQLWVEQCRLLKEIDQSQCPTPQAWAKQVCRMRVFDNLIGNIDRNEGNLLVDEDWNLVLIDHSRAFAMNSMPFQKQMTRIDREFYERIKTLDEETLLRELKPWVLSDGSVRDILKRRDKIVQQFDRLTAEKGEAAVFPF